MTLEILIRQRLLLLESAMTNIRPKTHSFFNKPTVTVKIIEIFFVFVSLARKSRIVVIDRALRLSFITWCTYKQEKTNPRGYLIR